jgi:serine/threonine-protein kinase HipA
VSPRSASAVGRELVVVVHDRRVGVIRSTGTSNVTLAYDETYDDDVAGEAGEARPGMALSHSLPLIGRSFRGRAVDNWISGLLPDRSEVLQRWRAKYGITRMDTFALLWHVGEDVAGAAQFVRPDRLDAVLGDGGLDPVTDDDIAVRIAALRTDAAAWSPDVTTGQFSLAGAQAKFALARTREGWAVPSGAQPTTHIFKPAIPSLPDQDVCEHLTMQLASRVGLRVAPTEVMTFAGQRVLVVERFDRVTDQHGRPWRVHQEDMCQALGLSPTRRYETLGGPGAADIVALLRESVDPDRLDTDLALFIRALAFNWLVAGTDAHARNYALLHHGRRSRLAPLYDLNSFLPYQAAGSTLSLAMRVGEYQTNPAVIGREHWQQFATQCRLHPDEVLSHVSDVGHALLDVAPRVLVDDVDSPLPTAMLAALDKHVAACLSRL